MNFNEFCEIHKQKAQTHWHWCSWLFLKHFPDLFSFVNELLQAINQYVYIEIGRQSFTPKKTVIRLRYAFGDSHELSGLTGFIRGCSVIM